MNFIPHVMSDRLESVQYFTFVNRHLVERIAARLVSAHMKLV